MNYHMATVRDYEAEKSIKALEQYLKDNNLMLVHGETHTEVRVRDNSSKLLATSFIL